MLSSPNDCYYYSEETKEILFFIIMRTDFTYNRDKYIQIQNQHYNVMLLMNIQLSMQKENTSNCDHILPLSGTEL